jgi:hypothetical protein
MEIFAPDLQVAGRQLMVRPASATVPQLRIAPPAPPPTHIPGTRWGVNRAAKYRRAVTDLVQAQIEEVRARTEYSKAVVEYARAVNEVGELPEICEYDTKVRRLQRQRDDLNARTEVEQAKYGFLATQNEVDKVRRPRLKKLNGNNAVGIDALMRAKVDLDALGEDTRDLDESIAVLKQGY